MGGDIFNTCLSLVHFYFNEEFYTMLIKNRKNKIKSPVL